MTILADFLNFDDRNIELNDYLGLSDALLTTVIINPTNTTHTAYCFEMPGIKP